MGYGAVVVISFRKISAKVIRTIALALAVCSTISSNAYAFTCPVLQKSKGGADLIIVGNITIRRDLNASENQLGVQGRGILEEESTGYVSIPSVDGAAQIVVKNEEGIKIISVLSRDTWITTTEKDWILINQYGSVSCGAISDNSLVLPSASLSNPNLNIATHTVEITSPKQVLEALGL